MLRLLSSNAQEHKDFWKTSEPCHTGIHWIALSEYSQMSTHLPGFQSLFSFFASFCIGQISHQQHKGYECITHWLHCIDLGVGPCDQGFPLLFIKISHRFFYMHRGLFYLHMRPPFYVPLWRTRQWRVNCLAKGQTTIAADRARTRNLSIASRACLPLGHCVTMLRTRKRLNTRCQSPTMRYLGTRGNNPNLYSSCSPVPEGSHI